MTFGSLFAGIGGFDLGLERAGMKCAWQVEIDPFCNEVLAKHFPTAKRFLDIRDCNATNLEPVELICGGFPCQPFSCAGKRKGKADNRYLWPEMLRVISELKPAWVIGENVAGIINLALEQVCLDLEAEGYEVQPLIIPACAINAPHRRDRVWIIGYNDKRIRNEGKISEVARRKISDSARGDSDAADTASQGNGRLSIREKQERTEYSSAGWDDNWYEAAARLCGVDDGIPRRVDRLRALGNAVVPQIVEIIGRIILA